MRPDKNNENSYNSYLHLIDLLVPYVKEMGFTHVEFMPVMEHPFDGSWGYQGVGFFAPTSRFGNPQEFAALVDAFAKSSFVVNKIDLPPKIQIQCSLSPCLSPNGRIEIEVELTSSINQISATAKASQTVDAWRNS